MQVCESICLYVHDESASGGCWVSCFVMLHLIFLRQGLSLYLDHFHLGWLVSPLFLHGSMNLSSGPSACVARALTSSTPQTLSICFGDKVFYVGLAETCTQWYKPSLAINP